MFSSLLLLTRIDFICFDDDRIRAKLSLFHGIDVISMIRSMPPRDSYIPHKQFICPTTPRPRRLGRCGREIEEWKRGRSLVEQMWFPYEILMSSFCRAACTANAVKRCDCHSSISTNCSTYSTLMICYCELWWNEISIDTMGHRHRVQHSFDVFRNSDKKSMFRRASQNTWTRFYCSSQVYICFVCIV